MHTIWRLIFIGCWVLVSIQSFSLELTGRLGDVSEANQINRLDGVEIKIAPDGPRDVTHDGGAFRIVLPADSFRIGSKVVLALDPKSDQKYKFYNPWRGEIAVVDGWVADIYVLPAGHPALLAPEKLKLLLDEVLSAQQSPHDVDAATTSTKFNRAIAQVAKEYGFSPKELDDAIRLWARKSKGTFEDAHTRGLAALGERDFRRAAELFLESGEKRGIEALEAHEAASDAWGFAGDLPAAEKELTRAIEIQQSFPTTPSTVSRLHLKRAELRQMLALMASDAEYFNRLEGTIADYRNLLGSYSRETSIANWVSVRVGLSSALAQKARVVEDATKSKLLDEALELSAVAVEVRFGEILPREWAETRSNRSEILRIASISANDYDSTTYLGEAIAASCASLDVLTSTTTPLGWAFSHFAMGSAYLTLGDKSSGTRSKRLTSAAISEFRMVLTVISPDRNRRPYAITRLLLGNALLDQYFHGKSELAGDALCGILVESAGAYKEAWEVFIREEPTLAKSGLLIVLSMGTHPQPKEETQSPALYSLLVDHRSVALRIDELATLHNNLSVALLERAKLSKGRARQSLLAEARQSINAAIWAWKQYDFPEHLKAAERNLGQIDSLSED